MKVTSFHKVLAEKNKSQEKIDILDKFIQGVNVSGDQGLVCYDNNIPDCDVAVIQGWQHHSGKTAPHLIFRQQIIDHQKNKRRYVCTADSNLFLYSNPNNKPYHYLRYSFNGVFPNTGIYCDDQIDPGRWEQIKKHHGIELEPMKNSGRNILICLQRNGGWSMGGQDVITWLDNTVEQIRKHSDRMIIVRPHPKDNRAQVYLKRFNTKKFNKVKISLGSSLDQDLKKTFAVVNHNSSSIVGPIIKGYHAFITGPETSQCSEVSHTDFRYLESPNEFNRLAWAQRISMFHWNFQELENGDAWQHMKKWIKT